MESRGVSHLRPIPDHSCRVGTALRRFGQPSEQRFSVEEQVDSIPERFRPVDVGWRVIQYRSIGAVVPLICRSLT
jgi:hypothetical protein